MADCHLLRHSSGENSLFPSDPTGLPTDLDLEEGITYEQMQTVIEDVLEESGYYNFTSNRYHSYPWGTKNHPTKRWKCCLLMELVCPVKFKFWTSATTKMPEYWELLEEHGKGRPPCHGTHRPSFWRSCARLPDSCSAWRLHSWDTLHTGCQAVRVLLGEMLQNSSVGRKPTPHSTVLQVKQTNKQEPWHIFSKEYFICRIAETIFKGIQPSKYKT